MSCMLFEQHGETEAKCEPEKNNKANWSDNRVPIVLPAVGKFPMETFEYKKMR